jgi:hypothetical protein
MLDERGTKELVWKCVYIASTVYLGMCVWVVALSDFPSEATPITSSV